jgi:hypothetical protein
MAMNTYSRIRQAMRQNELEVLAHLRKHHVSYTTFFGRAWAHALDRLQEAKKVVFRHGRYWVVKGAGPVTGWQRERPKPKRKSKSKPNFDRFIQDTRNTRALNRPITLRVKVNGAGAFQMADANSRKRHWERL